MKIINYVDYYGTHSFFKKGDLEMFKKNYFIGNTPMIKINYKYNGKIKSILTKLEYFNLTGSIKIEWHII